LLGIWKNYDELEECMSMPELVATLEASRKAKEDDRRFFAQINDLEWGSSDDEDVPASGEQKWAEIQAKINSGGKTSDPNDIVSLSGKSAADAGFGIGQGLSYKSGDETEWWKR
jgi:hypothetical protein